MNNLTMAIFILLSYGFCGIIGLVIGCCLMLRFRLKELRSLQEDMQRQKEWIEQFSLETIKDFKETARLLELAERYIDKNSEYWEVASYLDGTK